MHRALGARIRRATPDDAEALAHLHVDVWEDAYANLVADELLARRRADLPDWIERWRRQLSDPSVTTVVAENETGLIGFASVGPPREDDVGVELELWALYVRASWWGLGIGHALVVASIDEDPSYLWVLEGNDRAIAFYRRHGFTEDGSTKACDFGIEVRMVRRASR